MFRTLWRNRYRRLDLRRGDFTGEYQSGYLSTGVRFEFAMIALLRAYVEKGIPMWEQNGWQDSANGQWARARALFAFWKNEIPKLYTERDAALESALVGDYEPGDELTPEREAAFKQLTALDKEIEDKKRAATLEFFDLREQM